MILEVGLGGRLDAVNAIDADCAVITSIDIDHTEYLGSTREAIGFEKAGIMRAGKPVVVSDPVPPQSVLDHAQRIGADLWRFGRDFNYSGDTLQWNWAGRNKRFNALAYPALRGANQLLNASGALAVFEALRERLPITAQAVRNGLALLELPGPRWFRTWIRWVSFRARTSCLVRCATRTSKRCSPGWHRSSTTGISPTCRRRVPPARSSSRSVTPGCMSRGPGR